ncbi:MAG: UDP-N-acetylmuramoyl-tripeptide--D-alanyl-D-alanine ligase [Bacteroidales bacterium]|nr:UDP-N-acetylmuramoyl-tripeptide--D-alanyl-D-alanine ligase [Bacteroidales bacterium]
MLIKQLYKIFIKYSKISIDSREDQNNGIFFALKGENFNGNKFAKNAIENGAAYAVVDEAAFCENKKFILVDDVLKTLQELAKYHRDKTDIPLIAITGSNGKTTTKELINTVLGQKFNSLATTGNFNNHIGGPLTILKITKKTEIAIIEMGANHLGEIADLCEIAKPNYGIITNIGKAHLEGFNNIEGVIKAKSELFNFTAKNNGSVFVNSDDKLLMKLSGNIKRTLYGKTSKADCRSEIIDHNLFVNMKWFSQQGEKNIKTKLFGSYNFENIEAAICIGNYFGVDAGKIKSAIENYEPANMRSQIIYSKNNNTIILDAYNANPSSMKLAIENFAQLNLENKVLIIGDMLETGSEEKNEHLKILSLIKEKGIRNVFLVGKIFQSVCAKNEFKSFINADELNNYFKDQPLKNSSILIKGSRGNKLESLAEIL